MHEELDSINAKMADNQSEIGSMAKGALVSQGWRNPLLDYDGVSNRAAEDVKTECRAFRSSLFREVYISGGYSKKSIGIGG